MKAYVDKLMGGRVRDKDEVSLNVDAGSVTRQYIQELINSSSINWSQIIGGPTTNTELKQYIDSLLELITLNQFEADQLITQEMKNYFATLLQNLTITTSQITDLDSINQEFKTYIDGQITTLTNYINQLVLGDTYTTQLKQYIDTAITNLKTVLESLIQTTVNTEVKNYIDQVVNVKGEATRLISGSVTWLQNLDFLVSPLVYQILNQRVESPEKTLTIPANVAANPMFALIVADIFGNVTYILGTPAPSPAFPLINSSTQILITPVYIPANSNAPGVDPGGETGTIVTTVIYDENIEWQTGKTEEAGVAIDLADTTDPAHGTKAIKMTVSGGASVYERAALISAAQNQPGISFPVPQTLIDSFTVDLATIFPDHKTDSLVNGIRHLVYYNYKNASRIMAHLISRTTGISYRLSFLGYTTETYNAAGLFSVDIPKIITFRSVHAAGYPSWIPVPAGDYDLLVEGFTRNDQQYNVTAAPLVQPSAAMVSFTAPAAVNAKGGNISLSLKTAAPWLSSTGLLLELYNAAVKVGVLAMLPGSLNGFNPDNTDYQRITLPIADFNPTGDMVTKLVIRPVNAWPNADFFVDNVTLQTGIKTAPEVDKYVESIALDANGLFTLKQTGKESDKTAQFAKVAKTGSYNDLGDRPTIPTIPTVGSIASHDYWTGTAAAYAAINPKLANTIYFVEE